MNRTTPKARIALATAICLASLATMSVRSPAATESEGCARPAWALLSWSGDDCR